MRAPAPDLPSAGADIDEDYRAVFEASRDGLIVTELDTGRVIAANRVASVMHGYAPDAFLGLTQISLLPPDSAAGFVDYLRALQTGGVFEGRAVHLRRDGSAFDVELRVTALRYRHRPCLLSSLRDVSQQVQADRNLQQQVETSGREQTALLEISQTLASALELKPALILEQLRVLIDYTQAMVFVLEDSNLRALAVQAPTGLEQAMPLRIWVTGPETVTALLNGHRPMRIADVWGATPQAQFVRSLFSEHTAVLLQGVRAWMWLPLAVSGRVIGGISVARPEPDFFTAHHADLALAVANQAAITLVNAQLYQQAQALAALQERQRLARNLHDAVNQSLFSAGLIAEVLPRLWDRDPDQGRRSLEDLRRMIRGALAELRPSVLTDTDLGDLLHQLGNALTGRTDIPVSVTIIGHASLPAKVQVALYRLCQEALSNIAKHAAAEHVDIRLQYAPGLVELHVRDDGRGFDPVHISTGHTGLSIMHERAEAIGASLNIISQPGVGTEILAEWAAEERDLT